LATFSREVSGKMNTVTLSAFIWRDCEKDGVILRGSIPILFSAINVLKPIGYVMHQQFNIQQLYALPTLYLCVLYVSENKQRLVLLTA